jgi:hypothetical protein
MYDDPGPVDSYPFAPFPSSIAFLELVMFSKRVGD